MDDLQALWQQQPTDDFVRLDPGRAPADALALADPMVRPRARLPWLVPFVVLAALLLLGAGRVLVPVHLVGLSLFVAYAVFLGARRALPVSALVGVATAMTAVVSIGALAVERRPRPELVRTERWRPFVDANELAACQGGTDGRSYEACRTVLKQDPGHDTAQARLSLMLLCAEVRARADARSEAGDAAGALEALELLHEDCKAQYFDSVRLIEPLSRAAQRTCAELGSQGRWAEAQRSCVAAARVRCESEEFQSDEPTLGWGVSWVNVRQHLPLSSFGPSIGFPCPRLKLFKLGAKQPELEALVPSLRAYQRGDLAEARRLAAETPTDVELNQVLAEIELLEGTARGAVEQHDFAAQQAAMQQLLSLERRFLPQTVPSQFSSRLRRALAEAAYERGRELSDRKDERGACLAWKQALTFGRDSVPLLRALTQVCTRKAVDALEKATSCDTLRAALDYAVDGDGQRDLIEGAMVERRCP